VTLTPGTRLGSYEIGALLGAGGMGEVYRARDTKLGRDVALKVLTGSVTNDPDRLARFEREARLLASLNHPHIGAIYSVEETAPASPGDAPLAARGAMRAVTDFGDRATVIARRVSWSPDGQHLYAAVADTDADIVLLDGLVR
jgi:serine/threonine protein kinase